MRLTRRTFIMATGISASWAVTGCAMMPREPLHSALVPYKSKPSSAAKGDWVASTCQGCTQWCAIEIFTQEGRAVRVRGNQLSKSNHGYVCPRGHLIPQQLYDPDRVKVPMKRTNPVKGRGVDPKFVPITWDEAMNTVADKLMELRKAGETHKLIYMRGRYSPTSTDLLYGTLPKVFGTRQLLLAQRHLRRSREDGAGAHPGLLRLPRLRPRKNQLPGAVGHRPAGVQPDGAQCDPSLPRNCSARHGDCNRPAAVERGRQGP